ncbi:MAG: hypothetical protein FGM22_08960 [Burkholderiaceae bacterium]|jgi:uncharacterized membrane protein YecN with MAPEG domain|nr:hypothetical protein [Burkholderiaceae bacterium]
MTTGIYAGLCSLMFLYLALPIVNQRKRKKIGLGDSGDAELQRAIRVHANFIEYVPLILLLMLIAEVQGTTSLVIHAFGLILVLSRLLHANGLGRSGGYSFGRFYGTLGTWLVILGLSGLLLWTGLTTG